MGAIHKLMSEQIGFANRLMDRIKDLEAIQNASTSNRIGCELFRSTNQSLTNDTANAISFSTVIEDEDNMADLGSQPTRITFKTKGLYYVNLSAKGSGSGAPGDWSLLIRKNGSTYLSRNTAEEQPWDLGVTVDTIREFEVDDYLEGIMIPSGWTSPIAVSLSTVWPLMGAQRLG